ncbi:hypothetical protein KC722_01670 [Candidatus Kaiserbacteria bacterium]|nr:hypothetical protein [Candidatus Kaiserbacteria bacterium]MCB9811386.1 hypothetical protein [Candidatus Nomurabacteria bacterium]
MEGAPESIPTPQSRLVEVIKHAKTLEEVAAMFKGYRAITGEETIHDPETGNDLPLERVATAISSGSGSAMADEVPVYIIRALNEAGLVSG